MEQLAEMNKVIHNASDDIIDRAHELGKKVKQNSLINTLQNHK